MARRLHTTLVKLSSCMPLVLLTLAACPPSTLTPSITAIGNPNVVTISGTGFANIPQCARLSFLGETIQGQVGAVPIGLVGCSGGAFQNFNWPYSYAGTGCVTSGTQTASILATDPQGTTAGAAQTVTIPWGTNCALSAACGQSRQPPCPGGTCATGFVSGSDGLCDPCGGEGAPVCPGNTCSGRDLHLNFQGGQIVCTWNCGHASGASCPSSGLPGCGGSPSTLEFPQNPCETPFSGSDLTHGGFYACYDSSMIDTFGNCDCVPNTLNTCPVSTNIPKNAQNYGLCIQGKFAYSSGATYGSTCP